MRKGAKLIIFYPNCVMKKNNYLFDYSERIKQNHLNKGKLHLNKNASNILSRSIAMKFQGFLIDGLPVIIQV